MELPEVDGTIREVVEGGQFDKCRERDIPVSLERQKKVCSRDNVERLLKGEVPQGVDEDFAARTAKIVARKAPLTLKMANELIEAQKDVDTAEAIKLELGRLQEIFSTEDALAGLQAPPGRPPEYHGR